MGTVPVGTEYSGSIEKYHRSNITHKKEEEKKIVFFLFTSIIIIRWFGSLVKLKNKISIINKLSRKVNR